MFFRRSQPTAPSHRTDQASYRRIGVLLVIAMVVSGLAFLVSPASATTAPWVQSDKDDYPPGALVQLTGGDWQPGEAVHIHVNDDQGRTWERHSDVVADDTGAIADTFNLPDWFVATYKVLATGELSGTAAAGFTDGNVKVSITNGVTAALDATLFQSSTNCSGSSSSSKTMPGTMGVGNADSLKLSAATTGTSTSGDRAFTGWTVTPAVPFTKLNPEGSNICILGSSGNLDAVANYADSASATTLTSSSASGVYGGSTSLTATLRTAAGASVAGRTVSFTLGGTSVGTAVTNTSGVASLTGVALAGTPAGTYAGRVAASFAGDTAFGAANATSALTVTKAPLTVMADDKTKTYGDANPALTYSVTGLVNADSKSAALKTEPILSTVAASTGAGIHPIGVSGGTSDNYALSYIAGKLTIAKAPLSVVADDVGRAYGEPNPTLTYSVGGLVNGDSRATALPHQPALATTATTSSPQGSYPITITGGTPSANYTLTRQDGTLTVAERAITVTATPQTKTYGTADPDLTFTITKGSLADGDSLSGSLNRAPGQDVGTYRIDRGTLTAGSSYALTFEPATLQVTPRNLTVSADARTKVYGDADPALTYELTDGTLAYDDALAGALSRAPGQDVGTYAISRGDLTAGPNYDVTYAGADLTITTRPITVTADARTKVYGDADPALTYELTDGTLAYDDAVTGALTRAPGQDVGSYGIDRGTLTAGNNYDLTYRGAELTVTARPITITADAKEKVYGDADPRLTYAVTSGSLVAPDAPTGSLSRVQGEKIGSYDITLGTLATGDNYRLTFEGAQLVIAARALTITADPQTKTYGDADPTFTYKITAGNLANGDTLSGALTRESGENVGTYPIRQGSLTAGTDYRLTFEPATLRVGQAPLTVTADDKTRVYGDANPVLTGTVAGTVNDDVLTPSYTTEADKTSKVGTYPIVAAITGAALDNYDVTLVDATLRVGQAPLTVTADDKTRVYGDANPVLTGTVAGTVNDDVLTPSWTTEADKTSKVGTYPIVAAITGAALDNYDVTLVDATLRVGQAPLSVTADNKTRLFRGQNPVLTGTVAGIKNDDVLTASYTTSATTSSPVGSYDIVPSVTGPAVSNYDVTLVNGTLKIMFGWSGFLQPINDTAHQTGVQQSKFKLGQTIPAKFVIKDAAGTVVQQATSPRFSVSGNRGSCGSGLEVDTVPAVAPEAGLQFGWTGTHYQYNWSTKGFTPGEYRMWANLADGSTVSFVDICLTK